MIELADVHKRYGRTKHRDGEAEALAGLTLVVPAGHVTALVGPNGAGKTTLFGIALGFLAPTAGDATIAGKEPRDWLRTNGAGWLPERFTPPGAWRVLEALTSLARLDGIVERVTDTAATALERFGLEPYRDRRVDSLSRGQLQRLGLAQALIAQHELIVLDEPTGGLDPEARAVFRESIDELRLRGTTVLLASHDIAEIERVADTVVLLEAGRIRDIVPARSTPDYTRFRLRANAPRSVLEQIFTDATLTTRAADALDAATTFTTAVRDAADLNTRLAALIAAGGVVLEVTPRIEPLEERIARTLDSPDTDAEARTSASETPDPESPARDPA